MRNTAERLAGGSALHGVTKFSDLSQDEFEGRYLRSLPELMTPPTNVAADLPAPTANLALVDWTGKYTTAVKDQGYCGSCWAFSATEQLESDAIRMLGKSYILSPQQCTSCDTTCSGCNGGWPSNCFNYVQKTGGIETLSQYPYSSYSGVTGTCKAAAPYVVTSTGYVTVSSEANMASYVQSTGPLSICIDATTWNSYTGGIVKSCGTSVNHAVQAVGVDTATGGYWKVRNSWGTGWGESGFIRLAYGSNMCRITYAATHVNVK